MYRLHEHEHERSSSERERTRVGSSNVVVAFSSLLVAVAVASLLLRVALSSSQPSLSLLPPLPPPNPLRHGASVPEQAPVSRASGRLPTRRFPRAAERGLVHAGRGAAADRPHDRGAGLARDARQVDDVL